MSIVQSHVADSLPLNLSTLKLTDEQFYDLCVANPQQPLELTRAGILIVMPPVGGESGKRELNLGSQLYVWNEISQLGEVFSSSTIFKLPLGSQRSPDAAWIELSRWNALSVEDREKFPPLAPDFVIELRSRTDNLSDLQEKMLEYRDNGVRLGLLINPQDKQVEVYQLGREVEVIQSPHCVSCENVLPGFNLDLTRILS
ncbi:MAG: Uma2 family endonuclease [Cyanomargarita calcarea GSE-NOS-MK-12-04C]|jgi:Uma2 family endonuclease|uniref:Uma2 family endonuclease n=1 Tax=Cyanomargarita calcarea GSE-NOS-MK-12-04C TaxID=2839659 RepID=A0A951QI44_9CYAN|nr:Uma2 family endonuclease [Cyanomargarita calcarea GSE-NOS-MK-12-04C]